MRLVRAPRISVQSIVPDETDCVDNGNVVEQSRAVGQGDRRQSGRSEKRTSILPAVISDLPVAMSFVHEKKRRRRRRTIEQVDDDSSTSASSRSPSPPASKLPKPSSTASAPELHPVCTVPSNSCLSRPFRRQVGSKTLMPGCLFIKPTSSLCLACTRQAREKVRVKRGATSVEIHVKLEDITVDDLKSDQFDAKKVEEWMALMSTAIVFN